MSCFVSTDLYIASLTQNVHFLKNQRVEEVSSVFRGSFEASLLVLSRGFGDAPPHPCRLSGKLCKPNPGTQNPRAKDVATGTQAKI